MWTISEKPDKIEWNRVASHPNSLWSQMGSSAAASHFILRANCFFTKFQKRLDDRSSNSHKFANQ